MITEAAESPMAWSWAAWSPERHSAGGNRGFMELWNIFAMFYWRQWHSICFFILVPWEPVTWSSWVSAQDIFPVKKFSFFYFSRCYSQQFLHFAKCTWHVICGTDCVIWVNMCGMLSVSFLVLYSSPRCAYVSVIWISWCHNTASWITCKSTS